MRNVNESEKMFLIFKEVLVETFASLVNLRTPLAKCLALPVLILAIIDMVTFSYPISGWLPILLLLRVAIYTLIAVTTHRIILLGSESVSFEGVYKWGKRETQFALYLLLLALLIIPIELLGMISNTTSIIATIFMMWVVGRFALVFPGIAIGEKFTFELSRIRTQKYNLLMFTIVGIIPFLLIWLSILLVSELPQSRLPFSLFTSIFLVFEISIISHAFKSIHNRVENS